MTDNTDQKIKDISAGLSKLNWSEDVKGPLLKKDIAWLLTELKACREALKELNYPYYDEDNGGWKCIVCDESAGEYGEDYKHKSDCKIQIALHQGDKD